MKQVRATYGACDNAHKLLTCDDPQAVLPRELDGLTDRPPGDIAPGDIWWPAVGCGPVGDWWCLWWTQPDLEAARSGMVRSEVALWTLEQMQQVEDLIPFLSEISGGMTIVQASEKLLVQVAEAILFAQERPVIICDNLNDWPSIIAGIWCRLWPAARMEFSARLALSPPQNGGASSLPWITGVPGCRTQQWQRPYTKVELQTELPAGTQFNRASWFLAGRNDQTMTEILAEIPPLQSDLGHLTRAARVAENFEKLQKSSKYDDALALLRTLIVMAPTTEDAGSYKKTAVATISQCMLDITSEQIESLANLNLSAVAESKGLVENLCSRIEMLAPQLPAKAGISLLSKLCEGKAQHWWQAAVKTAVQHGLEALNDVWAHAAIGWLAARELEDVLHGLIRNGGIVESKLLKAAQEKIWNAAELEQLCEQAKKRKWAILHAWSLVAKKISTLDAFTEQKGFTGDSTPGFDYLIHSLPAEDVVKTVVTMDDPKLCSMAAQLTKHNPELLQWIDISKATSRLLWATHIQLGGNEWPKFFKSTDQGNKLLEVVVSGEDTYKLVEAVGKNVSQAAVDHPRRKELWGKLSITESNVLLPLVANILIERVNTGQTTAQPEPQLTTKILEILRTSKPSGRVVSTLFTWNMPFSEHEIVGWFCQFSRTDWQMVVPTIGQVILTKKWGNAAKKLYDLRQSIPELIPAVESCRELLSRWERFKLMLPAMSSGTHHYQDVTELINQIADVGSDLAPEGLDEIWERAGGKKKNLESKGTPSMRWQNAARLAANGAKCSLVDLVKELKRDFPNNAQLRDVEEVLRCLRMW